MRRYLLITALLISLAGCRAGRVTTTQHQQAESQTTTQATDTSTLTQVLQEQTNQSLSYTDSVTIISTHVILSTPDSVGHQYPIEFTQTLTTRTPKLTTHHSQLTTQASQLATHTSRLTTEKLSALVAGKTVEKKQRHWHTWPLIIISLGFILVAILFLRRFKLL